MVLCIGMAVIGLCLGEGEEDLPFQPVRFHRRSDAATGHAVTAELTVAETDGVHSHIDVPGWCMEQSIHRRKRQHVGKSRSLNPRLIDTVVVAQTDRGQLNLRVWG